MGRRWREYLLQRLTLWHCIGSAKQSWFDPRADCIWAKSIALCHFGRTIRGPTAGKLRVSPLRPRKGDTSWNHLGLLVGGMSTNIFRPRGWNSTYTSNKNHGCCTRHSSDVCWRRAGSFCPESDSGLRCRRRYCFASESWPGIWSNSRYCTPRSTDKGLCRDSTRHCLQHSLQVGRRSWFDCLWNWSRMRGRWSCYNWGTPLRTTLCICSTFDCRESVLARYNCSCC